MLRGKKKTNQNDNVSILVVKYTMLNSVLSALFGCVAAPVRVKSQTFGISITNANFRAPVFVLFHVKC